MKYLFKKIITAILIIAILLQFSACSGTMISEKSETTFENGLENVSNDAYKFDCITDVYLLKDKFIYTTLDESIDNNFGDAKKLMICDLITGKVKSPDLIPLGDINNMCYVNDKLYFTAYSYTSTDWGFCLFCYDIENDKLSTIYETPNTVQDIYLTVCADTIFYLAGDDAQDNISDDCCYNLHMYANDKDTVIAEDLKYGSIISSNSNGAYFAWNEDEYIYVDCNGNKKSISKEQIVYEENGHLSSDSEQGFEYIAIFGDYKIALSSEKTDIEMQEESNCGYKYSAYYYLYDTKTSEYYKLTRTKDWYYYI